MSAVDDAVRMIKDTLKLVDEAERVGETLKEVTLELREHDRRLTRLETKWHATMELAAAPAARSIPARGDEGTAA